MNGATCGAAFVNVMDALLMEYGFKFTAEFSPAQGLRKKVPLECFVLQVVCSFLKPLLAVDQCLNYQAQCRFEFN